MTVNLDNASLAHAPEAFIDERRNPFIVEILGPKRHDEMVQMYLSYEPRNSFNGLPPLNDNVCRKWVQQMIQTGVNLVAISYDYGMVGHASLLFIDDTTCELFIVVAHQHQQVGIGTELTRCAIRLAYELGTTKLWLAVEAGNKVAQHVYRKCGFNYIHCGQGEREMAMDLSIHKACLERPVDGITTKDAVFIRTGTSCREAADILLEQHVSVLPVLDEHGCVEGIVAATDMLAVHNPHERVGDILTRGVTTVRADCPIKTVIRLLQTNKLRCIPVTDISGKFIGVVGRREVLSYYLSTVWQTTGCDNQEVPD